MKGKKALAAISGMALLFGTSGCETFTGGGWIVSPGDSTKKATFGLQLKCQEGDFDLEGDFPDARLSGHLTFHDHGTYVPDSKGKPKNLAFKASVDELLGGEFAEDISCDELDELAIQELGFDAYLAAYFPQPPTLGEPGLALIHLEDNGKQGPDKGDRIAVELIDGAFDGYFAQGEIQGGQITLHQDS